MKWLTFIWYTEPRSPTLQRILYQLNHQGNPRILEWVAYPFSSGSFRPRNWTRVSFIAGRFFTSWATREPPKKILFIILTSKVCPGSSCILDRLSQDRIWYQGEKPELQICSGFNFQCFKRFLSRRSCMTTCLSLVEARATCNTPAVLLNPSVYSTWKILVHSSTF